MTPRVQGPTFPCDCGKDAPVTPVTAYEFTVTCACGWQYRLSWAHHATPPVFAAARAPEPEREGRLPWTD
jgi:hypothetical protein